MERIYRIIVDNHQETINSHLALLGFGRPDVTEAHIENYTKMILGQLADEGAPDEYRSTVKIYRDNAIRTIQESAQQKPNTGNRIME